MVREHRYLDPVQRSDLTGPSVPVYRYWHPFDHITVRWRKRVYVRGRLGPGSVIEICEDIGGKHAVRAKARVSRFGDDARQRPALFLVLVNDDDSEVEVS